MKKPAKKTKTPDAFTDSDKHVLKGIKLFPWTPSRVICANGMGMIYPRIGKDGWDQYKRTRTYPGCLKDVIICLWLMTQSEDQVDEADTAPVEAYRKARTWASGLGIHRIDSDEFWQAYGKFAEIMGEVDKSFTQPAPDDGSQEEEPDPNE